MSWRQFESVFGLYSNLRWPADQQVQQRVSSFLDRVGINSPTRRMKGWVSLAENPSQEPRISCAREPAIPTTAQVLADH